MAPLLWKSHKQKSKDKRQGENPGPENIQVPDSIAENARVPIIPKAVLCCAVFNSLSCSSILLLLSLKLFSIVVCHLQ